METSELIIEKRKILEAKADPEKFEYFVKKYFQRMFNYFYYRTSNKDDANDLVWMTFEAAYSKLSQFVWRDVSVGAWLYTIARYLYISHRRKKKRLNEIELEAGNIYHIQGVDMLSQMVADEEQQKVNSYLMKLDEISIEIFQLRYLDELSIPEISTVMGVKQGTIKARLSRDMKKLVKEYNREHFKEQVNNDGVHESKEFIKEAGRYRKAWRKAND